MKLINEPSMGTIDDYNNQESPQKRRNIRLIIIGLIIFSGVLNYIKLTHDTVDDYIGTPQKSGVALFH